MLDLLDDPVPFVPSEELVARARARGTHLRRRRRATRMLAAVPVLVLLVVAVGAAWVDHRVSQVDRVDIAAGVLTPVVAGQPYNVLVVGTDSQPGVDGVRSDTQFIVRVDRANGTLRVLSLPRDLVLTGDSERLNTKIGAGGPDALISAIHDRLGIGISHYVAVDFQGFVRLLDAAGGISVQADTDVRDDGSGLILTEGCQHLDGKAALALVRARHLQYRLGEGWDSDRTGDLGRIRTQQLVLDLMLHQLQARANDPATLEDLLTVFADNTTVDAGFGRADLLDLAHWGAGLGAGSMSMATLPAVPEVMADGSAVLRPDDTARSVVSGFAQGQLPPADGYPPGPSQVSACP